MINIWYIMMNIIGLWSLHSSYMICDDSNDREAQHGRESQKRMISKLFSRLLGITFPYNKNENVCGKWKETFNYNDAK